MNLVRFNNIRITNIMILLFLTDTLVAHMLFWFDFFFFKRKGCLLDQDKDDPLQRGGQCVLTRSEYVRNA